MMCVYCGRYLGDYVSYSQHLMKNAECTAEHVAARMQRQRLEELQEQEYVREAGDEGGELEEPAVLEN